MPKALLIETDIPRRAPSIPVERTADSGHNFMLRLLLRSPKDALAGCVALAAVIAIITNATFMQSGHHPAPMFNTEFSRQAGPSTAQLPAGAQQALLPRPRPIDAESKPSESRQVDIGPNIVKVAPAQGPALRPPAPIPAHSDPVGDLIVSTRRIANVQRALTEFAYGQLKPTGVVGTDTQAAITKFEKDRKLPVTGQMSDRLVRELSSMTGRTLD